MQSGVRRALGAPRTFGPGRWRWAALLLGLATAGCNTSGQPGLFSSAARSSVAFEAIDGPPAPVFRKLVSKLNDEAQVRQIAVVSREAPSQYRVRAYVAAQIQGKGKRNTIAWVWDVYDSDERRAVRLSGEEQAGPYRRDAWASADEKVLSRIAQSGMQQLAEYLNAPGVYPPPVRAPERDEPVVVASADNGPGIFSFLQRRTPAAQSAPQAALPPAAEAAEPEPPPIVLAAIPVPRPRPDLARKLTAEDLLTYATSRRDPSGN